MTEDQAPAQATGCNGEAGGRLVLLTGLNAHLGD